MTVPAGALVWALPAAAVAHVTEEFAVPGGFGDWYRSYRPELAKSMTPAFFFRINALFIAASAWIAYRAAPGKLNAWWFMVAGIMLANAVFHMRGALKRRSYCPGLVTSIFVYVPLVALSVAVYLRSGYGSPFALLALLAGPAYHGWSAWNHARRSAA